jgi:hypothetical protein
MECKIEAVSVLTLIPKDDNIISSPQNFHCNMKNIIILILLATAFQSSCQPVSAGNNNIAYQEPRKAFNVSIGSESVYAYFQNAEFILSYCGEVTIEIDGQSQTQNAVVCQYEPGVWTATMYNGDYVRVSTATGVVNISIRGEFRTFVFK